MSTKQNNSPPCGSLSPCQIQQKLFVQKSLQSKCWPVPWAKLATVPLEHRSTVNSEWYTTICWPKVFAKIRKTNKSRRFIVHHDIASSHTSTQISDFLNGQNVELMAHSQYSPDLALNDLVFIFVHQERNAWSTIFVARRCC